MRIARACMLGHVSHVQGFVTPWMLEWVAVCFSGDLPDPGIAGLCCLLPRQAGCLPLAPPGKPRGLQGERRIRARGRPHGGAVSRLSARRPRLCCASALSLAVATPACLLRPAFLVSMLWFTSHVYLLVCPFPPVLGLPRSAGFSWFAVSPQSSPRSGSPGRSAQALEQRLGEGGVGGRCPGLVALRHVVSSHTRDRTSVPCIGRRIPIHHGRPLRAFTRPVVLFPPRLTPPLLSGLFPAVSLRTHPLTVLLQS